MTRIFTSTTALHLVLRLISRLRRRCYRKWGGWCGLIVFPRYFRLGWGLGLWVLLMPFMMSSRNMWVFDSHLVVVVVLRSCFAWKGVKGRSCPAVGDQCFSLLLWSIPLRKWNQYRLMFLCPLGRVMLSFHTFCFHLITTLCMFLLDSPLTTVYDIDSLSEKTTDSDVESASLVFNASHCTQAPWVVGIWGLENTCWTCVGVL